MQEEQDRHEQEKTWEEEQEHLAAEDAKAVADVEAAEMSEAGKQLLAYAMIGTIFRQQQEKNMSR